MKRCTSKIESALNSSELFNVKFIVSLLKDRVIQAFHLARILDFFPSAANNTIYDA